MTSALLQKAYAYCVETARTHYENFPVASRLLPRGMREPVSVIYTFARNADDFADEGEFTPGERLQNLDHYSAELHKIERNEETDELLFIALKDVVHRYQLPLYLFHDLLQAFRTDVTKKHYQTFPELLDYCRLSANPVGRILLYLNSAVSANNISDKPTDQELAYSDAICTGLQLINFFQDIAQDYDENRRIYIPLEEMQRFSVTETDLAKKINNAHTQALMKFQLQRARSLYQQGKPLGHTLSGRFGLELRLIYAGGERVLHKLEQTTVDIYARPRLTRLDKLAMARDTLLKG